MRHTLLLIAAFVAANPITAAEPAKRNVVLLIADDLGLDLGCYGNGKIHTPNLDALARDGVRFTHAFATVASCSPSRASLYTGLYTHTSGQYGLAHATHNFNTRPQVKSLPALLKTAGYRTGIISKLHVIPREVYPFDEDMQQTQGRNGVAIAKKAKEFIEGCKDQPFCLVVGYTDPHRAARGFDNDRKIPGIEPRVYEPADVRLPYHVPDTEDARKDLADYYQAVSRLDQNVGLMRQTLKDSKRDADTLVIFLSDNGIPFPGAKTTLYDAGVRLPLIVSSPALKKRGTTNEAMASWVDVLPTILDWAGAKIPANLPGRSILPILEEEKPKGWDTVYGSHQCHEVTMYYPVRMIRTRTHKYLLNLAHKLDFPFASDIYNSPTWQGVLKRGDKMLGKRPVASFINRPKEELYDLTKDPDELKNVADDPAYADVLKDLRARLKDWQEKTQDPWLVKYTHE